MPIAIRPILLGSLLLLLASACAGPTVEVFERPDGTVIVETTKTKATVTAVDARDGTVTLQRSWMSKPETYAVDTSIVDLTQVRVGDTVRAEVIDEFAVSLVPGGAPPEVGVEAAVALTQPGEKPMVITAKSVQVTAEILAIDGHAHTATLGFPDGSHKTVKVGKHIDLSEIAVGDSVLIEVTEAVAVAVTKD